MHVLRILPVVLVFANAATASGQIVIGHNAPDLEHYAALELQRYVYQLTGTQLPVGAELEPDGPAFLLGTPRSNALIARQVEQGSLRIEADDPGPQGYVLKTLLVGQRRVLTIAGADASGVLYGVYGMLDDHFGVGFYLGGDVLPPGRRPLEIPELHERRTPAVAVRGFLPWTNFPQSATVYSWEDWRFIIDQAAKMRMNFIHVHNYNGQCGHNEMYHNFDLDGFFSRVWMPTARTGHRWACPGFDVREYRFGAADLFDDYDFGADCALHNENLTNEQVFRKGTSLFRKVIEYAHRRGVRIGLGLDVDLIPPEYKAGADEARVVEARVKQLATDYPDLDYLLCFQSEMAGGHEEEFRNRWRSIVLGFYDGLKRHGRRTRIAVAGWGISPEAVRPLPADIICAPISAYSDGCETGAIYGDREYWGCPWLERDFRSSQYYYPYNMHLSNTIQAFQERSPNMKGFYCLTWRLTDTVDAKMSYIAKAPWDGTGRYRTSTDVYREYAQRHYGPEAAGEITAIIDQNEPFGGDFGECQATPALSASLRLNSGHILNIAGFRVGADDRETPPFVPAASAVLRHGTRNAPCSEGGECVGFIDNGHWLSYEGVDFGRGATYFEARIASPETGGEIEVRLDGESGPMLGQCMVPVTGGWQQWQTVRAPIEHVIGMRKLCLVFRSPVFNDEAKAVAQIGTLDKGMARTTEPQYRARLGLLRCRLAAVKAYIDLDLHFPAATWEQLPGAFPDWVANFTHRVTDISSLGNVQSTQNRFVQLAYVAREEQLRAGQQVKSPSHVVAKGTRNGARIFWRNRELEARGYFIYRNGERINSEPLAVWPCEFTDTSEGLFSYAVSAVRYDGAESPKSVPSTCPAGAADNKPPSIIVISPPTSILAGQPLEVKARLLDDRDATEVAATLVYRQPGTVSWKEMPMVCRVKAVFAGVIPAGEIRESGIEYFVRATDGENTACQPPGGENRPWSAVVEACLDRSPPEVPRNVRADGLAIAWTASPEDVLWYRIYRSRDHEYAAGPATRVTYVSAGTTRWQDNAEDFEGRPLIGTYCYRLTAVDQAGNESAASDPVHIAWPNTGIAR